MSKQSFCFGRGSSGFLLAVPDGGPVFFGSGGLNSSIEPTCIPCVYSPDFFLEEKQPFFSTEAFHIVSWDEMRARLKIALKGVRERKLLWRDPSEGFLRDRMSEGLELLARKGWEKAVPVCGSWANGWSETYFFHTLSNLLLQKKFWIYALWDFSTKPSLGILGLTPELLFSCRDSRLETMALAGTAKVKNEQFLLTDPKEAYEHSIVVGDISSRLSSFGDVEKGCRGILNYGSLVHLFTPMSVHLKSPIEFKNIVCALHPTPALGSFPRVKEIRELKCLDFINRRRYGAPFSLLLPHWASVYGRFFSVVAIRNFQWWESEVLQAYGCGLVKGSQAHREAKELIAKRNSFREFCYAG